MAATAAGNGALPQNRYPAFLDLVRAQIARDYPASSLAADGLAIHTTLSPSSQHYGERAVVEQLQRLDRDRSNLQAALRMRWIERPVSEWPVPQPHFPR